MRRKLLLLLLCGLTAFVLLLGGAVLYVSRYMSTPEFRAEFARLLQDATGQTVSLEGELGVSVFPWLGIYANGITLGNAPGFGPEPMLKANSLSAHIRVIPLLRRRLSLDMVEFMDAEVSLRIDPAGTGSWEALVKRIREGETALGAQDTKFRKVVIRGVRIKGGKATLVDDKRNQSYVVSDLSLSTGRIESGKPLAFALSCSFHWPRPGLDSRLDVTGKVHWDEAQSRLHLSETVAQGTVGGTFMPEKERWAEVATGVTLENDEKDLHLSNLRIKILGADLAGELTFVDFLDRFEMRGRVVASRVSPRAVINAYFPNTIPPEHQGVLSSAEGPVELFANEDEMRFQSEGFKLDASRIKGKLRLGFGDKPGLDFDFAADRLDADAYAAAFSTNATGKPLLVEDLPLDYLRGVTGKGLVKVETLKLAGVTAQEAELSWAASEGNHRADLRPAKAQGGLFAGELAAVFAGTPQAPTLGVNGGLRLEGVDARHVPWLGKAEGGLSGRTEARVRAEVRKALASPKEKVSQLLRRATGEAFLSIGPGSLDFGKAAGAGKAAGKGKSMAYSSLSAQARFSPALAGNADWALQADGSLAMTGTKPVLNLDGRFSALARPGQKGGVALSGLSLSGRLKGWFLPRRENEASFAGKGGADFSTQTLTLTSATAQSCGLNLAGSLSGTQILGSGYSLSGHVRCLDGDPRRVVSALDMKPLKPSDRKVMTRVTGEADIVLTAKGVYLTNLNAQVDDTGVRGTYSVTDFDAPRQSFVLQANQLDLDRYRAAPEPVARGSAKSDQRPAPEPLPVEDLRSLNLDGTIAFRSLKIHGLTARRLKATVAAQGGTLTVKPLAAEFYGGELNGEITAQAVQQDMRLHVVLAAKGFQAGGFMLGWVGKEYVTGRTDLTLDLTGAGDTDTEYLKTLEGAAAFKIIDGSYTLSGNADTTQQRRAAPPGATPQAGAQRRVGTPFWQAGAKFSVSNGVFRNRDFRLEGPDNIVTGRGSFSIADDTINVNLNANMPGVPDVPIKVYGRLKDPEMNIRAGMLLNNTLKEILGIPLKPIKFFKDLLF
ncbi:MAG: AsmA family protein [Humidesulfovibrio sp.]|uniref:AsmA family protein n=1 Tax=Humidesulfovibrio sp. TaxID=2910988 RepID=UPI0027F71D17|nr:AsmA family protein [Humidesulfovibrio sp.]MDQ7835235.1 AsmA family protein [Humidesulfovibrio sp.]